MPGSKVTLFTMLLLTQDQIHDGTGITHPFSLFTPSSPFIVDGVWIVTVDGTIYSRPMAASLSASPYISNPGGLGIFLDFIARSIYRLHHAQTPHIPSRYSLRTNLIWKDTGIKMSTKTTQWWQLNESDVVAAEVVFARRKLSDSHLHRV